LLEQKAKKIALISLGASLIIGNLLVSPSQAQEGLIKINRIDIQGNKKTKDHVIFQELSFREGDLVTLEQIEEDRKRIQNLGLFSDVEMRLQDGKDGKSLAVLVYERRYIFPSPVFFVYEQDINKLCYGISVTHINFRGRGEYLQGAIWLGYRPGFRFFYRNRKLSCYLKTSSLFSFYKFTFKSIALQYEVYRSYRKLTGSVYRGFKYNTQLGLMLSYRFPPGDRPYYAQNEYPSLEIITDYNESRRIFCEIRLMKAGLRGMPVNYWRYRLDIRGYLPLVTGLILASRAKIDLSKGIIPSHHYVVLNLRELAHGSFNRRLVGKNLMMGSVEIRTPLKIPLPGKLRRLFRSSACLFLDTGIVWRDRESPVRKQAKLKYGFGLRFHLPYIRHFRVEYALDEHFQREIILDTNAAF